MNKSLLNLDCTICEFVLPLLVEFRATNTGYPASMTEEEWNTVLDKMIRAMELNLKDGNGDILTDEEELAINEGFGWFGKYLRNLWI